MNLQRWRNGRTRLLRPRIYPPPLPNCPAIACHCDGRVGTMETATALPATTSRFADLWPGVTAALSFSCVDILIKVVYSSGMDVMTLITLRGVLAVAFLWVWLRFAPPAVWHPPRQRLIALALGL